MPRTEYNDANVGAFLDMLAISELGRAILAESDDGYNVIVGSLPGKLITFDDYSDHPNRLITVREAKPGRPALKSTAAGRYQQLYRFWPHYKKLLNLPDFGPESQDACAVQQLREQKAYNLIVAGQFEDAVSRCRNIWASLPGAGYGQHENKLADLRRAYEEYGGIVA